MAPTYNESGLKREEHQAYPLGGGAGRERAMSEIKQPDWAAVEAALRTAIALPGADRAAFLTRVARDNPRLRAEVEGLLTHALSLDEPQARVRGESAAKAATSRYGTGDRVGAYRLRSCLATGGSSEVYLAERADGLFAKCVAVKILVAADEVTEAAFERECQLLAELDHPGIVSLLDAGRTHAGDPYLVLAHVAGLSLMAWAAEHTPPLETRVGLLQTLASVVGYAHQRGIVHCDIKPANVLVTSPTTLKLLDFGIARGTDREDITALSTDYAAPERLQGQPSTAASDVFSLGVTAFELLTGQLPWPRAGGQGAASPRGSAQPPLLSVAADDAPAPPVSPTALRGGLERIVSRCLAWSPTERYSDAVAVAEDLQRWQAGAPLLADVKALGSQRAVSTAEPALGETPPRPAAAPSAPRQHRFVGRQAELALLDDLWADACEGRGEAILVHGPPGIGKTRLVEQFIAQHGEGATLLRGAFHAAQAHRPFAPIVALIEASLSPHPQAVSGDHARLRHPLEAAGCTDAGDVGLLGRMLGWPPDPAWPLPAHSPEYGRRRVFEILTRWVLGQCAGRALILVLEDLHWADDATLDWLCVLRPTLATQPVLLLATGRSETRSHWGAQTDAATLNLRALRSATTRDLLAVLTDQPQVNAELAAQLHARSGGNPLFLEELVQRLRTRGDDVQAAWRDGGVAADLTDVPASIVALTEERLNALGPARALAEAIAVVDSAVTWEQLFALLGAPNDAVEAQLDRLVHDGLIRVEGSAAARRLSFAHALLRDATYAGINTDTRRELHAQVAALLAQHRPPELARIASHFERADEQALAREYWTRAAEQAADNYANSDAIKAARCAIDLSDDPRGKVPIQLVLGTVLGRVGQHAEAIRTLQDALAAIPTNNRVLSGRAWRLVGDVRQAAFEHGESASAYFEASQRLDHPPEGAPDADWDDYLHVRIQQAGLLFYLGAADDMIELLDSIADDVALHGGPMQRLGLRRERGRAALISQCARVDDDVLAMEYETLAMAEQDCGPEGAAVAHFSVGFAHLWRDELAAARQHLEAAAERLQHTGQFQLSVICDVYLACLWRQSDDPDRALDFATRVEQRAGQIRMPVYLGVAAAIRAWAAYRAGDMAQTEAHASRTYTYLRDTARIPFPFRWLAALPLLAARRAAGGGMAMADELAQLLEPPQHRLPPALHTALQAAVARPDARHLDALIAAARRVGYLP